MTRLFAGLMLLAATLLGACGSDDDGGDTSTVEPSASPTVDYFVAADTDAINEGAVEVTRLSTRALKGTNLDACDRAGDREGYAAWRRCWHELLDPLEAAYRDFSTTLTGLVHESLPEACQEELSDAAAGSLELADVAKGLAADIDSDARRDQGSAMSRYVEVLTEAQTTFNEPFVPMTNACFSPEELATITTSPTSSAS